jgi:hypothetical protein
MTLAKVFPATHTLTALPLEISQSLTASILPVLNCVTEWPIYQYLHRNIYPISFLFVFLLRYIRVLTSLYGTYKYRPTPIPLNPTYHITDVTVIIPTTDLMSNTLHHVVRSILDQQVPKLIIATAGTQAAEQFRVFRALFPESRVIVSHRVKASRREQTAQALKQVDTRLVILQDDHTYWPQTPRFIASVIAPFEDAGIGAVSADLQARHHHHPVSWAGFWNFMGMTYLTRRSYEYRGTYGIDRGLSTLPGRFGVFRTAIYASPEFLAGYLHSYLGFQREPLNSDDDKFHTRWLIEHDWDIGLQAGPDSVMTTELGEWPRFLGQVLRWTRTTWRSNPAQLMGRLTWVRHPFVSYSLLMWFFRQSLTQELCMYGAMYASLEQYGKGGYFGGCAAALTVWIVGFKFGKISEHFRKYPQDVVYFPAYLLFGHLHVFIKIYALLTCTNASWTTAEKVNENETAVVEKLEEVGVEEDKQGDATERVALDVHSNAQGKPKRPALFVRRSRYHSQVPGVGGWVG